MIKKSEMELLIECTKTVLETMCFAFVIDTEMEELQPVAQGTSVSLDFEGTLNGALRLDVPNDYAEILAAAFLGTEGESDEPARRSGEVVCELANMICGSFLTALRPSGTFALQSPKATTLDPTVCEIAAPASFRLITDEGSLSVAFSIN